MAAAIEAENGETVISFGNAKSWIYYEKMKEKKMVTAV